MIGHTNKQTNREYYFIYTDIQYLLKDYVGVFKHSKFYRTYLHDLYVNKNRGFQKPLSQRWLFGLVCTNFKYFSKIAQILRRFFKTLQLKEIRSNILIFLEI